MKAIVLAGALACALPVHSKVLDLHADIRAARSGELTVTERLTLEVDDRRPHSILQRELPVDARIVDVIRNGHPEGYTSEKRAERLRLRIGKSALDHGRHTYQLTYRAPRPRPPGGGLDELAWRIDGGDYGVERITAEITLPVRVPALDIRIVGAKDQQSFVRDGRAAFRSTRALAPGEAMTVALRFPHGVVASPRFAYGGLVMVLSLLLLTAAVLYRLKKKSGTEP
jgi:hypothetical protein